MAAEAEDLAARLRAEFPHALRNGQLVAYYQPEVDLSTGRVVAAEALARWEHPELGTLPPALFTQIAEQLGLMGEFTRLMLKLSLTQHRAWAAAGMVVPIAVNVGPDSVIDPAFPAMVTELLRREQVPGPMLALEVSEQTGTAAVSSSFFAQLAEAGVRIALDDFGTGFASMESLGGWPVDELKLDMSLVRPIASRSSFRTIVRTTVDLAHQLGVKVVAEGVESEAVRSELRALGCDIGQGYFLGRPMPPGAFAEWMRDRGHIQRGITGQAAEAAAEASARVPRWLHRVVDPAGARTLAAALVIMAAYGLWQVFRWGGHQHQALIGDLAFFPPNAAGGYCAWRVSRRTDLGRPTIRAWRLLSVAVWLYLLGDAIQLIYEVVLHQRPDPTWADAAYIAFYPVASAGLLAFPARRRTRPERVRGLLDVSTVFVGGATLLWYVALGPAVASKPSFDLPDLVIFAYPIGDLLLLFGVVSLLWRGVARASVLPLRVFATGMLVFIVADVTYDYVTIHAPYNGGDPVDTLWMLALTIVWVAAACQLRVTEGPGHTAPPRPVTVRPSMLPYLAVAASYLLLTVVGLRHLDFDSLGGVLLGAALLTVLVSVRQIATLHDYSRLALRYQELASVDGMTGLFNRRHFMEVTEAAFAHAQRLGQPLIVLMLDVDHFKEINDVHGHAAGDRVLADLAQSCREHTRPDDITGRYGGDEFILVIPGISSVRAIQIAARLTGPPARITGGDGQPVVFTVSVGIAEIGTCPDLAALLGHADAAMYEAKRAGGGCWRLYEDTEQAAALSR
ncbi:MAG: GGDEF domain-containing protein [Streptosporangiaceae bacterium]|jgi:diguanylate cyclase (GGDEF)-like protein